VITFDARNHGDSPAADEMNYEVMCEDVIGLADQLDIPKFILLVSPHYVNDGYATVRMYSQFLQRQKSCTNNKYKVNRKYKCCF
jgi:hypothetical protein